MPLPQRPSGPWRAAVPGVMLVAGLLFGTSAALARGGGGEVPQSLPDLIQERTERVAALTDDAADLETEVRSLAEERSPLREVTTQADQLAPQVGTAPVEGPAVRVTLDDAGYTLETLPEGYTVDDVVVHQQDVQGVINALWAGGAEAMMVQDQRIIATSAVQCVGNTLYLQGRVYSPPYTITAIGDPGQLQQALEEDPVVANYRAWADLLGLGYEVEDLGVTQFPAFSSPVRTSTAEVTELGEPLPPPGGQGER